MTDVKIPSANTLAQAAKLSIKGWKTSLFLFLS